MASIAAVPSVSNNTHASVALHAQDADDFDSVLASVGPAHESQPTAQHHTDPIPIAAPRIVSTPVTKQASHGHRSRAAAKRELSDDGTRQNPPSEVQDKAAPAQTPAHPIAAIVAPAPVTPVLSPASAALRVDDDADGSDVEPAEALAPRADAAAPKEQAIKTPLFEIASDVRSSSAQQSVPVNGAAVPSHVVDEIVAAAGNQPKQAAPQPQPAANPAGVQNVNNLMMAARASVVVMPSPEPAAAVKSSIKADTKAAAAQSADIGKAPFAPDPAKQPGILPQQEDSAESDAQNGKPASQHAQVAQQDQSTATSDKPVEGAPTQPVQAQQQIPPNASQIVAGPPTAVARAQTAQAPLPEAQPNMGAIAASIAAKATAGSKTFEIRLDPPELGRVDVHLTVDNDGRVQAMVMADRPHTLDLLQRGSHDLERALKDAGLNLSNNSLNFSLKGEGRQGDGGGASMARTRSLTSAVVARAEAANASEINLSSANGRLDIRV